MIECVVNVSEGRDAAVLRRLADACAAALIDTHVDADHHRSVFTLASSETSHTFDAVRSLAQAVADNIDVRKHSGVHPRLGALDVVPFVSLSQANPERAEAVDAAHSFGRWWSTTYDVPVFFYDEADASARDLPQTRAAAFETRQRDLGPEEPHVRLGATTVGARRPMAAVNCFLASGDVTLARRIAGAMRERDGGLRGVRALGFFLESRQQAQVSMNLVDLEITGVQEACEALRSLARSEASDVASVELVGLVPASELERWSEDFVDWSGLKTDLAVETRVGSGVPPGPELA